MLFIAPLPASSDLLPNLGCLAFALVRGSSTQTSLCPFPPPAHEVILGQPCGPQCDPSCDRPAA